MYDRFSQLMKRKGVTAYQIAKTTGISQTTFSDWKNGRSVPKADKMQKIADFFEVSVEYLLSGEESEQNKKPATQKGDELSEEEIDIIMQYRAASDEMKAVMRKIAGIE